MRCTSPRLAGGQAALSAGHPAFRPPPWSVGRGRRWSATALRVGSPCADDALRIKEGFEPHGRQVDSSTAGPSYWNAPQQYGPMMGGYFNGLAEAGISRPCS